MTVHTLGVDEHGTHALNSNKIPTQVSLNSCLLKVRQRLSKARHRGPECSGEASEVTARIWSPARALALIRLTLAVERAQVK